MNEPRQAARPLRRGRLLAGVAGLAAFAAAAAGFTAVAPTAPAAVAPAATGGVIINEVSAASWRGAADEDGDVDDWVELYNPLPAAVDLTGYGLSNKAASPFRWVFPAGTTIHAHGYLTVWLSQKDRAVAGKPLHASFNLDNGADTIQLTASNGTATGTLVDTATPAFTKPDQTWCRMPSGSPTGAFRICERATKGAFNGGTGYLAMTAKPVISPASGFYDTAQTVTVTAAAGAAVRYTLDGTVPTWASTPYTGPFTVAAGAAVRAVAFVPGEEPSPVETATYVVGAGLAAKYATKSAVLVAMPPADYARYQAKDRSLRTAASFQLLANNTSVFKQDAEGKVAGQLGSTGSPQVQLNVTAKDGLGAKSFTGALWPEKPTITSTKGFRLRNASNDWNAAHLRDQFTQSVPGTQGPNLYSSSRSVAMFVNGAYYGLMEIREREDERMVSQNLGVDKDLVDDLSDPLLPGQEINNGGAKALADYQAMHTFVTTNDMSVPANYAKAVTMLNPESLAWDWGMHLFTANYDWPGRNVHVWRSPETDGRWNWAMHDMDFSYGRYSGPDYDMSSRFTATGSELVTALLANPGFKAMFLATLADQVNLLTPAVQNTRLDTMVAEVRPYIADLYAQDGLGTEADWDTRVAAIRTFIAQREAFYDSHLKTRFGLGDRGPLTVATSSAAAGGVRTATLDLGPLFDTTGSWTGRYYPGSPVTLTATPRKGFVFTGWQDGTGALVDTARTTTVTLTAGGTGTRVATFAPVTAAATAAPTIAALPAQSAVTGDTVSVQPVGSDPQGYPLTWTAKTLPKGVGINATTGRIYGTITTPGVSQAVLTATSASGLKATLNVTWTVTDRPGTGANGTSPDAGPGVGTLDPAPYVDPAVYDASMAVGRAATQSSVDWGGSAARAVDGNTDGSYWAGSVTHTANEASPWWQVDLGAVVSLDKATLWNRTDCCADRLTGAVVVVSSTDPTGRTLADLEADPGVTTRAIGTPTAASLTVDLAGVSGRYVRVQLPGPGVLSLAEVQVAGWSTASPPELALGRPATQSSTYAGTAVAARAVDGNTNGDFPAGSVTHTASPTDPYGTEASPWWQVDLGSQAAVDTVTLWNRTDCCSSRWNGAVVVVSPTNPNGRTLAELQADPAVTTRSIGTPTGSTLTLDLGGAKGRYVRVQLPGTGVLSLAEVSVTGWPVVSAPVELATGQAATQSSTYAWTFGANRAVDGNTNGDINAGSVTHTASAASPWEPEDNPWWQVDLGSLATLNTVTLWNRTDCCGSRWNDALVLVSATDPTGRTLADLLADPAVTVRSLGAPATASATLNLNGVKGRFVRVQLPGRSYLQLAEVQVSGWPAVPPPVQLATGRPATQSSTYGSLYTADRAVDGNTNGDIYAGSVTHTASAASPWEPEATPWWQVDLGSQAALDTVTLWNRTDCCSDRWNGALVIVSATDPTGRTLDQLRADPAVVVRSIGTPTAAFTSLDLSGITGRYVRVQLPGTGYLQLAEVQVTGRPGA